MGNLNAGTITTLPADRYQVYIAPKYGPFLLAEGVQSSDVSIDVPVETLDELGNDEHRGTSVDIPTVSVPINTLLVDTSYIQNFSNKFGVTIEEEDGGTSVDDAKVYSNAVGPLKNSGVMLICADGASNYHIDISGISTFKTGCETGITYLLSGQYIQNVEVIVDASASMESADLSGAVDSCKLIINCENDWDTTELRDGEVDVRFVVRNNSTDPVASGVAFKSVYADGNVLQNLATSFPADGNATANYETETEKATIYDGYVLRKVAYGETADATAKNILDLDSNADDVIASGQETPIMGKAMGSYASGWFMKVTAIKADGTKYELEENTTSGLFEDTISGLDKYYNFAEGETTLKQVHFSNDITAGDRYEFTYFSPKKKDGFDCEFDMYDDTAIKGRYIPVRLGVIGSGIDDVDTATSASISMSFSRERLMRLGAGDSVTYGQAGIPEVTGDIAALDNDLKLVKMLRIGDSASTDVEFSAAELGDFSSDNDVALRVRINDPSNNTTKLFEFEVDKIQITGEGLPMSVGANTTHSFNYTSKDGKCKITR